jgi:phage tail-like protein
MEPAIIHGRLRSTTLKNDMADKKTTQANKYYTGFHFNVTFIGIDNKEGDQSTMVPFAEVSGIENELHTDDVTDANLHYVYRLPKPLKGKNLVLKRALSAVPSAITKWAEDAINNYDFKPCTVVVSILNEQHQPIVSWNFSKAYPLKISVTNLNANKSELLIETMELAYLQSKRITLS